VSSHAPKKPAPEETEKYDAFDRVTEALGYLSQYNSLEIKDGRLLNKADKCLIGALEIDPGYFKARYLQAMLKYLKGEQEDKEGHKGAISLFRGLLNEADGSPFAKEISYNLAAAYSERNDSESWQTAITHFNNAISLNKQAGASHDPEMELLARVGLLKSYVALQTNALREKKDVELIKALSGEVTKQEDKIKELLRPGPVRGLLQLLRFPRSRKSIRWRVADRAEKITDEKLGRKGRRSRRPPWNLSAKVWGIARWALAWLSILFVFALVAAAVFIVVVSVYLYGALRPPL
jgi:hypothetical protein